MDKQRLKLIITGVLIIVLVLAWSHSIKILINTAKRHKSKKPASASLYKQNPLSALTLNIEKVSPRQWEQDKGLDYNRCPFSGKVYSAQTSVENLHISGIIWDNLLPQAIINGQIIKEGDIIGNFRVKKIEKKKVILSDGVKAIELHI